MNTATIVLCVGAVASIAVVGFLSFASEQVFHQSPPIHVLVYETAISTDSPARRLYEQSMRLNGVTATIFGQGHEFEGYGSKYAAAYPLLKDMPPSTLVVLSDGRDVLLNHPASSNAHVTTAGVAFRAAFDALTRVTPGAVVVSAEAQCCVSALTHVSPGDYFDAQGRRVQRACLSGEDDCLWQGDERARPWEAFMHTLAMQRIHATSTLAEYDDVYLNAGLMVGTAADLVRLMERANIGKDEDDQAVLTDFMYRFPDAIVLDYGQTLFGNNRGGLGGMDSGSCMFALDESEQRLVHTQTLSSPLFVHSPGGFLQCHDDLSAQLGFAVAASSPRRLQLFDGSLIRSVVTHNNYGCNYGHCGGLLGKKDKKLLSR